MAAEPTHKCFVCGHDLTPVWPDGDGLAPDQCHGAVMFRASGNYGSQVWDLAGPEFLLLNICDPCLVGRRERVTRVREVRHDVKFDRRDWISE